MSNIAQNFGRGAYIPLQALQLPLDSAVRAAVASRPITPFLQNIVSTVDQSAVTLITAETGAGKSLGVPTALAQAGYRVIVTEPRILLARTLSERAAFESGVEFGGKIGYRTARESKFSAASDLLYCTDGLALVREIMGHGGNRDVLIIDEVHEFNTNIEVLLAWAHRQLESGSLSKLVLMSATMEADKLAKFYNGAPIISVPGRLFPVEERAPGDSVLSDTIALLREGRNVLVFEPGKKEITEIVEGLRLRGVDAEILPLHGELDPEQQARCFRKYNRPFCIVGTNIVQTGATIPGISAVVDSGLERRLEVRNGIEGLYIAPIAAASTDQRMGRAGRDGPGIFIDHHPLPRNQREPFPVPEIKRTRLDQTVLRILRAGFDPEVLNFFHQPPKEEIHRSKRSLAKIGCIVEPIKVTPLGEEVDRLRLSPKFARMVIEAEKRGVLDDILTAVAILEIGGITRRESFGWREYCRSEDESDVLAQVQVYNAARNLRVEEMKQKGIMVNAYRKVSEMRGQLISHLKKEHKIDSTGNREDILKSICAGLIEDVYQSSGFSVFNQSEYRELGRQSVVRGGAFVVGVPFDIEVESRYGKRTLKLLTMASKIEPEWLEELAPHLITAKRGFSPYYDSEQDSVVSATHKYFDGMEIGVSHVPDAQHPEASQVFAEWLAKAVIDDIEAPESDHFPEITSIIEENREILQRARELEARSGRIYEFITDREELKEWFLTALAGAKSMMEIGDLSALKLPWSRDIEEKILKDFPDHISIERREFQIDYAREGVPVITLSPQDIQSGIWKLLPDAGLRIPNGESITVKAHIDYWYVPEDRDLIALKKRIAELLDNKQFTQWQVGQELVVWHGNYETLPEVVKREFGKSVLDGSPLYAYGSVSPDNGRMYWTRDQFQANRMRERYYENLKHGAQVAAHAAEQIAAVTRHREEQAARRAEIGRQRALGQTLENFGGNFLELRKNGAQIADFCVIRADGTLRPADFGAFLGKNPTQGSKHWDVVEASELALGWICKNKDKRVETGVFTIHHLPVDGLTPQQIEAVARLEREELRVDRPVFQLDKNGLQRREVLKALEREFSSCPATGKPIMWDLKTAAQVMGKQGVRISESDPRIYNLIDYSGKFFDWGEGAKAQEVYFAEADEGAIQLIAIDHGHKVELVLRWQKS